MEFRKSTPTKKRGCSWKGSALYARGLVQALLEHCASVKVKRLFMFLAENCKHGWAGKVDLSKVDFGSGKRVLKKGGRFDAKYQITVPSTETGSTAPGARA
jgi:hypothetical protein